MPRGPQQRPLPGFSVGPRTWGRILPDLPRRPPWQSRLPVLELPGAGTKASAHRTLHGDFFQTTGVAALDVGFAAAQKIHRFRDIAVARAGPNLLPQEVHLFWTLHGHDLPEPIRMPAPWRSLPTRIHMGSEAQLLPRFLRVLEGQLIVAHNLGTDQSALANWFRRVNLDEPMPRPFHGYDTPRAERGLSAKPCDLASTYTRYTKRAVWWKSTIADALMALDIARHQTGSLPALQQAAAHQMTTYTHRVVTVPSSPVIWLEDGPCLPYGTPDEPLIWSSDITHVRRLEAAPLDYVADLLHTDLDLTEKKRIFDWLNQ